MSSETLLSHQFLIAMPGLRDPNFQQTVSYICEHNEQGAIGIVINKPLSITLDDVFSQMNIQHDKALTKAIPVFHGGPVEPERGFVIHGASRNWRATLTLGNNIYITSSQDILEAIAQQEGPDDYIIALGYAGWEASQLENELLQNSWLNCPADYDLLFNTAHQEQWKKAASLIGIDISQLSHGSGHA